MSEETQSKIDKAIKIYRELRDELKAERKKFKEYEESQKEKMERLSMFLKKQATALGLESLQTKNGTAYPVKKEFYRIGDFEAFCEYIKETGNFHLLEKRVAKLAAKEVHDDEGLPPGILYSSEIEYQVRKPSK